MPTFASVTFGCKVNQYESQALREELLRRGYAEVPAGDRPDLYLVNTCTVTETARKEAEKLVRSLSRGRPDARFAITGCAADSFPGIPGVRSVVPQAEKHRLPDLLDGGRTGEEGGGVFDLRISRFDGHTRAFVKVEDGCDLSCSFCIIPKVRGGPVSRPIPAVLDEIRRLLDHGHKEIVLTGVHLGAYGRDLERRPTIPDLVEAVLKLAVARVRLSSIEVNEIEERLIDLLGAEPRRLCPHLHLPLQSGDEGILRAMRRRYSPRQFLAACERVAARVPDPSFTTDVIVGFPGETEERFERSVEICRRIGMSRIHVFPYSPRPGTEAAALPDDVPRSVKRARLNRLKAEASRLTQEFCRRFVGREVDVLVEEDPSTSSGQAAGYTERYLKARVAGNPNDLVRARVTGVRGDELVCDP